MDAPSPQSADPPPASRALVVFSHAAGCLDGALKQKERIVTVAGRCLRLRQQWAPDGRGGTGIGFGAAVYPAAIVLSHFLEHHFPQIRGRTVVELGCGVGLCAVAAAVCGAARVVATDGDETSVALTRANVQTNGVSDVVSCRRLLWGDQAETAATLRAATDAPASGGLVILGADITACPYADALPALVATLEALCLGDPEAVVLLAHTIRHVSEESFWELAALRFDVKAAPRGFIHPDFREADEHRLSILRLKR